MAMIQRLLLCLVLFAAAGAQALQMPIYEGEVALAADEGETSERALREALAQVLVKVSGDRSLRADPDLPAALADARRLAVLVSTRSHDGARTLAVNFDPGRIHDLLTALGRPIWQADRPALLVWLAIDDGSQKQIANANQVAALDALTRRALDRGLPVLLPRMDGVDQNRINPVTLWVAPPQTVIAASQRYAVTTMLVIRLTRGSPWRARYTLIDGRSYEEWEQSDPQSNTLLAAAIDGAGDRLARRYALEPQGNAIGLVQWWIDGIDSAADYASVIGYLGKLEFVRGLQVQRAAAGRLLVQVDLAVGERRLQQLLGIDGRLELLPADGDSPRLRLAD